MNVEVIEDLVKVLASSAQLTELEVRQGTATLRLRRAVPTRPVNKPPVQAPAASVPQAASAPAPVSPSGLLVRSELVGVFRARRPDAIDVGHSVKAKHVLGQIEAMRLMNDVPAPTGGRVQAVLVQDGQPIEYGQPLFEIAPEETS